MIKRGRGNLIEADAEAFVNTVNTVGIMGRGVALQFRKAFPANYEAYRVACERGLVSLGRMFVFETHRLQNPRLIINFPTKQHWKEKSRIEHIRAGLVDLVAVLKQYHIKSVAIPPLGCGLGGLNWGEVRPLIVDALGAMPDIQVILYEPMKEQLPAPVSAAGKIPNMTRARAELLLLAGRYMSGLMDFSITLLEIHKLMYFMQEAGEPLKLNFKEALYGPYAENLRHVLIAMDGYFIHGYGDGADEPGRVIELSNQALEQAEAFMAEDSESKKRIERVSDLIEGFETPRGMELLATVLWVTRHGASTIDDAVIAVHNWNDRKKMFRPEHVAAAWQALENGGWLRQFQAA